MTLCVHGLVFSKKVKENHMQISGFLYLLLYFPCSALHTPTSSASRTSEICLFNSAPFLGSSTLCGCQKVSAPRKAASSSRTLLIPLLSVILGLFCPLSNVWKLLFHSVVQLSDPKSGIHHIIKVQKRSPQLPDINTTILALLRLLGIWNIFPDFFI